MLRRVLAIVGAGVLSFSSWAIPAAAAPSDGNGNKEVVDEVFGPFPIGCGDVEVVVEFVAQFREPENGGNVFLNTYIVNSVYTNGDGETWVFTDRGADRGYLVDGELQIAVTGRSGFGNIGRLVVVNPFTPDEEIIFQKGQPIDPDAEACERLA